MQAVSFALMHDESVSVVVSRVLVGGRGLSWDSSTRFHTGFSCLSRLMASSLTKRVAYYQKARERLETDSTSHAQHPYIPTP